VSWNTSINCYTVPLPFTFTLTKVINRLIHFTLIFSFLVDRTARGMICYWDYNAACLSVCDAVHCGWTLHPTAKVSEQVNRKCRPRNKTVQFSIPYTELTLSPQTPHPPKLPHFHVWNSDGQHADDGRSANSATAGLLVYLLMQLLVTYFFWITLYVAVTFVASLSSAWHRLRTHPCHKIVGAVSTYANIARRQTGKAAIHQRRMRGRRDVTAAICLRGTRGAPADDSDGQCNYRIRPTTKTHSTINQPPISKLWQPV